MYIELRLFYFSSENWDNKSKASDVVERVRLTRKRENNNKQQQSNKTTTDTGKRLRTTKMTNNVERNRGDNEKRHLYSKEENNYSEAEKGDN